MLTLNAPLGSTEKAIYMDMGVRAYINAQMLYFC